MEYVKKKLIIFNIISLLVLMFLPCNIKAENMVDIMLSSMSNEEKIAQMLMPSFIYDADSGSNVAITSINSNIETALHNHGFAGIILFDGNTQNVEQTVRLIDSFQTANSYTLRPQLFIAIDQEGGYVTRLKEGTATSGNMALSATNDSNNVYMTANIIGSELNALGINLDFAPVVDVNSNPSNPIIGIRSFSDDPNIVGEFGIKFISGLQNQNVMTAVKHFPGHGDTNTDTHLHRTILNKSYDELKNLELIPFKRTIDAGTDMVMISHISFPNIENTTFHSLDGNDYTLPATVSSKMLKDILRTDMGYNGIIITDALNMDAITKHFEKLDVAVRAINAGADILLIPFDIKTSADFAELETYITTLASKIGNEIDEEMVNASVRRILTLKEQKGLLNPYDSSNLDAKIANAKNVVSSISNHEKEFEIAKKGVTLVKNDNNILPIKDSAKKTVIIYGWSSHANSIDYAIKKLINDNKIDSNHNISKYRITESLENIKEQIKDADNIIIEYTIESEEELNPNTDETIKKVDDIIEYAHSNNSKVIYLSAQLPYDLARFQSADALMAVYNPTGMSVNPYTVDEIIPRYGPNIVAGIYMIFANGDNVSGKLPVNIPRLTSDYNYSSEVLYQRGYGLNYVYDEEKVIDAKTPQDSVVNNNINVKPINDNILKREDRLDKLNSIMTIGNLPKKGTNLKKESNLKKNNDMQNNDICFYIIMCLFILAIIWFGIKKFLNK